MFKKLLLLAWVSLVVFAVSCKGPEGDVGPAGPKGDTGAAGPQGPAGENTGSGAIVISSGADSTNEEGGYVTGLTGITPAQDSVLQASAVLVYIKSGGVYWPLPGVVLFDDGSTVSNFTFVNGMDGTNFFIQLLQTNWSEDQDTAPVRKFEDVKVVIVPGNLLRMNAEVLKSYEKTIAALGITDKDIISSKKLNLKALKK
ncbi:collagen-like protein [Dyadobacter sandarakinus]|uniref:Collagen-like protein n=2 Tax=Dyadobacter sandarakinus TaxID=2747268 RepID=A0ABX7IDX1_9BACT|nr:collagen-like protein [Dyadobacter sandarakinus]